MAPQKTSSFFQVDLEQGVGSRKQAWLLRGLGFAALFLVGLAACEAFPSHTAKPVHHVAVSAFGPGLPGVRTRGWLANGLSPVHKGGLEAPTAVLPKNADGIMSDSVYPAAPANLRKELAKMQVSSPTRAQAWISPELHDPLSTAPVEPPMTGDVVSREPHNAPGFPAGHDDVIMGADTGSNGISLGWLSILVVGAGAMMATTARSAQQRSDANTSDPASSSISLQRSCPLTMTASPAMAPEGTPVVPHLGIRKRPRRNRRSAAIREMVSETHLLPANFINPCFVHDGTEDIPIPSMPGVCRLGVDTGFLREVEEARKLGVMSVVIFPKTADELKTMTGEECFNLNGLAQRAIRNVKKHFPDVTVYTDIALDPYNSLGHDGIVRSDGVILNDETIFLLCKQAVSQAEAGADFVSPSDMMDGRIGAIRDALDEAGYSHVGIMAYSAKYSSAFYGPFRDALDSNPRVEEGWSVPDSKDTYQQDPANYREALLEAALDEEEGADILMVKPGLPYLDVIKGLHEQSNLPIAAYHVSGEYAMLKAAAQNGWLDEKKAVLEALLSIKRAGATVILTYYAKQAAGWLKEDNEV